MNQLRRKEYSEHEKYFKYSKTHESDKLDLRRILQAILLQRRHTRHYASDGKQRTKVVKYEHQAEVKNTNVIL